MGAKRAVMADSETTPSQQRGLKPWEPGQSGNPNGRPKGSRNKLQEDFLRDVLEAWETRGPEAISDMIEEKPAEFVKMVAGLMPKEATLTFNDNSEMTDDELAERVRQLAAQLAPLLTFGAGDAEAGVCGEGGAAVAARVH